MPAEPDLPEAGALPRGGRGRGLVLHKLMEEVLTGETDTADATLRGRAAELVATCPGPASDCHPAELAATVLRTLALPDVAAVRHKLVPEFGVAAMNADADGTQVIVGTADAVALAADGTPELVIDWKSDVMPDATTAAGYVAQVRAYLAASGAPAGLIVFMTTGTVLRVTPAG